MQTDTLIDMLARGAGPAPARLARRRLAPAVVAGLVSSSALALILIGAVPASFFMTPAPWMKIGYALALLLASAWLVARLGQPGTPTDRPLGATTFVVGAMALAGLAGFALAPPGERLADLLGHSWATCPRNVLGLSLPALAAALWALRGLAPTRLRAAGAAAGVLAGSLGALGYALSCTEAAPSFVAVWYTLGVALSAALGAVLGPRVLRW